MSLPQLAGASDCGPANPVANLMKQFHLDRSLQQDRALEQRGESSRATFRSRPDIVAPVDRQFTREFLRDEPRPLEQTQGIFEFSRLSRELESIKHHPPPENWAVDFMQKQSNSVLTDHADDHQFGEFESIYQQKKNLVQSQYHQWHDEFQNFQKPDHQSILTQHEREAFEHAFEQAKQGADMKWEKEFTAHETRWANDFVEQENINDTTRDGEKESLAMTAGMLLQSVDADNNPKFKNSQFMNLMRDLRDRKVSFEDNKVVPVISSQGGDWASEFGHGTGHQQPGSWANDFTVHTDAPTTRNMQSGEFATGAEHSWAQEFRTVSSSPATADVMHFKQDHISGSDTGSSADWVSEFGKQEQRMKDLLGKSSETSDWVDQYERGIERIRAAQDTNWEDMQKDWDSIQDIASSRATNPEYQTYNFALDNPYLLDPSAIEGVKHITLADSILALEAKAQLQTSNASAWQELGFKQQENERDAAAIAALRRAVSMDPRLIDGWLALAVSYTNENCRVDAYEALEQWILNNDKYKHLAIAGEAPIKHNRHEYITNLFLDAARSSPDSEMDADVQVGLGVLFNVSEEYLKAIDCFKAALQTRPQDYLLWNKLGATLANSRDSAAAIDAYFAALEINPSYVRARYNLAISCINLGQHLEAAEHLLAALAIQQQADSQISMTMGENGSRVPVQGGMSENVWDSLRMLMFMMNREDLAKECDKRNLDIFRGEFEF